MVKKIIITISVLVIIFSISSCKIPSEDINISSDDTYIETEVWEAAEVTYEYYDEDTLLEESNLIFKGTVTDSQEIVIEEYIDGKVNFTYYKEVFTFEIDEIYYSEDPSLEVDDIIKVSNLSNPNLWFEGTIKMEEGKQYIVLAIKTEDTFTVQFTQYSDYFTADHYVSIIRIEDGKYYIDKDLTSLISNPEEEIIRKDGSFKTTVYVKGKELEGELKDLILEKKGLEK